RPYNLLHFILPQGKAKYITRVLPGSTPVIAHSVVKWDRMLKSRGIT
ncbi:unnamed protein product, partial [marine sediment metagenome]